MGNHEEPLQPEPTDHEDTTGCVMVLGDWQKLWGTLDKDGNGTLDQSEIEVLLQRMGKEIPIEEMMKQIDADGDGTIDKAEFSEWVRANPNSNLAVGCGRIVDVVFRGGSILVESGNWQLEGVKVLGAATHGVVAANQCALTLDHSTVGDCGGRGLLISDDAHVKMDGCELLGNYMGGICCAGVAALLADDPLARHPGVGEEAAAAVHRLPEYA